MNQKNLRIALINPRVESYSSTMPPLGLLYIAAVLEKNDFEVRIFDFNPHDDRDVPALISFNPDVLGMTILTDYLPRAKHISRIIKEKLPNSIFFIGGVHVAALPKESLNELGADFAVIGEGENTMLDICTKISRGEDINDLPGVVWKKDGVIIVNPPKPLIENLDELPFPARHLLNFSNYLMPPGIIRGKWTERSTTVMTSRGCPFNCIWCGGQTTFGRKVRNRSVANVIAELKALKDTFAVDAVWFVDDTFTLNKARVMEFCDSLMAENLHLAWGCQAHVKTADEEMFKKMKQAGLVQLDFGVESGSDIVLKNLKKNSNAEAVKRAFSIARKCRIRTCATFIFGGPGETDKEVEETFKLAKEIKPDFTSSFFLTPYPGTELADMVQTSGWKTNADRSDKGLKKRPMLLIHFPEQELMSIRTRFQKLCAFRNFSSIVTSPSYLIKAFSIFVQYPGAILDGLRAFGKSRVFDDFLFAMLNHYVKKKSARQSKKNMVTRNVDK
jgi:radical SAM superfamily enzyme YgiQ (UPF0313 family)